MVNFLKLIRIHQWVKNIFVFLPIFFAGKLLDLNLVINSFFGFLAFSFIASSIYIINDYVDIESDKKHPEKKNRPLASGKIKKSEAIIILLFLLLFSFSICLYLKSWTLSLFIIAYFLMNLAYSFRLKHVAIIDVIIIALGFLFRVFVGGAATGLPISIWAILLTFFLALVMGIGKRRGELINANLTGKTRKALDGYNLQFTDTVMTVISTCAILCYIMYTLDPTVMHNIHKDIVYTSLFVVIGILRYLQLTFVFNKTESPTKVVYKDLFLQVDLILWIISIFILKYSI
ncbi:decaprenyl-phosphate phosphoribosyltransferase [Apibacter muscae]|uniref:decaprenyl-phosphate phosphoribosyltransferase n=1 Tax=Apibacter muscae TaxID=2509004 RepID=UPI0011AE10AC|nr:decaprenyl-phosphate phosphoribosyltransferase [Apibacter muscae]TWP31270.1 decaprenyl-phosphate phosphoribosyltransferase [Apibacter muscae]